MNNAPTQGGGVSPTPRPSTGKIDQMDVNRSFWIKKNIGACTKAGSDHGSCPSGYTCNASGDTITVRKSGDGDPQRIFVEKFTGCSCNREGQCRGDLGGRVAAMFDEQLGDDETGITCNINSDRCQKQSGGSQGIFNAIQNLFGR